MYCEKSEEHHDFYIPFKIEKGVIIQQCPCKTNKYKPRGHQLYSKITDKLVSPKKK
jgi:hypothetical protein